MKIPQFLREVIWSLYPPRYHELADQPLRKSITYMSKILLIAFLVAGLLFLPKLLTMKGVIQDELGKIETFKVTGEFKQTAPISVPPTKPFVVMDLNEEKNLTQEIFLIDNSSIQYRWFGIQSTPIQQLKDLSDHKAEASGFLTAIIILILPSIAILVYLRAWLKYFILSLLLGTAFFLIFELTRHRLKWKQMTNIALHASTLIILVETISAPISAEYLIQVTRFVGVNVYAVTTIAFAVLMVVGIVGAQVAPKLKKSQTSKVLKK